MFVVFLCIALCLPLLLGASDTTAQCLQRSGIAHGRKFIAYDVGRGAGFHNGVLILFRAVEVALLTNRTLLVRDINLLALHNSQTAADSTLPFSLFFDMERLELLPAGAFLWSAAMREWPCLAHESLQQSFSVGKYIRDQLIVDWTDETVVNIFGNTQNAFQMEPFFIDDDRHGERILDYRQSPLLHMHLLKVKNAERQSGWHMSNALRKQVLRYVEYAQPIRDIAQQVKQRLGNKFSCMHLRDNDAHDLFDYTEINFIVRKFARRIFRRGETLFLASNLRERQFDNLYPFFKSFETFTFRNFTPTPIDVEHLASNDYLASIEVNVCRGARRFVGSDSTMSETIEAFRHGMVDIDAGEHDRYYANVNKWLLLQKQQCVRHTFNETTKQTDVVVYCDYHTLEWKKKQK